MDHLSRREWLALATAAAWARDGGVVARPRLFCMDTAMVREFGVLLTREQIEEAARLGYSGIGPLAGDAAGWRHLVEHVVPWVVELKMTLPAIYSWLHVSRFGFELDPGIALHVKDLAPTRTAIWLPVTSKELAASSTEADDSVVAGIRQASDLAGAQGLAVSLYPHYGSLLQTVPDALRLVGKVGRPNVGLTFNLCHWLRSQPDASLARTLREAAPHLQIVTLCGADRRGRDWKQLIQPLDQGDFPVSELLSELRRVGFTGAIGLQGYDVAKNFGIAPEINLERSMVAWRRHSEFMGR